MLGPKLATAGESVTVGRRLARDEKRIAEHERTHGDWQARRDRHLAMVREALEDARGDGLADFVRASVVTTGTGARYSAKNQALISYQAPGAVCVRGLKAWRADGVSVPKDTGGIAVTLPGGRIRHVFEVSQTSAAGDPRYDPTAELGANAWLEDAARLEELEERAARAGASSVAVAAVAAAVAAAREWIAPGALPERLEVEELLEAYKLAGELEEH